VIEAEQTEDGQTERNDRLLAVAANSARLRVPAAASMESRRASASKRRSE